MEAGRFVERVSVSLDFELERAVWDVKMLASTALSLRESGLENEFQIREGVQLNQSNHFGIPI
jgi:hypothetical protein